MNDEVTHLPHSELRCPGRWRRRASRRRSTTRRLIRGALLAKAALVCVVVLSSLALYLRIGFAPLRFEGLTEQVTSALAERFGEDWRITLEDSAITLIDGAVGMKVRGLDIHNADGVLVARAPSALVSVSIWSVAAGNPLPQAIELHDVQLRVRVAQNGTLSLAPQAQPPLIGPSEEPEAVPAKSPAEPISFATPPSLILAIGSLLEAVLDPANPVGAIDYARIVDASLTLIDDAGREQVGFSDVDALFSNATLGRSVDAEFEGPSGRWRVVGDVARSADGGRDATIRVEGIPINDIILFAGIPPVIRSATLRLSGAADIRIDGSGKVRSFDARLASNAGRLDIDNPDFDAVRIDDISVEASWDPATERLLIETLAYRAGNTRIKLEGAAVADAETGEWRLQMGGRDAALSGATERDRPVKIEAISLQARGGSDGVLVENLSLKGEDVDVALALSFGAADDWGGVRVGLDAHSTGVRAALRLWPPFVAPAPREFLMKSVASGRLEQLSVATVITGEDFLSLDRREGLPQEALAISFRIADGTLIVNDSLPPLERLTVEGVVDGVSTSVTSEAGEAVLRDGRSLDVAQGRFHVGNFWNEAEISELDFRLAGPADALASFLNSRAYARTDAVEIEPDRVGGLVDLSVNVPLLLADLPSVEDIPIRATGSLRDLSLGNMLGKETLENGDLSFEYESGDLAVSGDALLSGEQATIALRKPRDGAGEARISLVLDDAARARRGFDFGGKLTGPIPLVIRKVLGSATSNTASVEADLTNAAIKGVIPGWSKPAGTEGRLSFRLTNGEEIVIDELTLDAGAARARGLLRLTREGDVRQARIDSFRISPGDDASATIDRDGSRWKVAIRGNVLDARPFLDQISDGVSPLEPGKGLDLDLDVQSAILTGHHAEAITNARLTLSLRADGARQFDLAGRFPGADIVARTGSMPDGAPIILVESRDAGATLRFADIYTHMVGGLLTFQIGSEGESRPGIMLVRDFLLRDEPALRTIVSQQTGNTGNDGQPIDFAAARFTQARADFVRTAGRIDLVEAVMWGSEVGFKLDGFVDYAIDFMDVKGTFVPAYGLNNAFAQVPLFGVILGGNRNEGLFGVNFRVSGPASAPALTINPLSAIAPGFLRQLFGASGTPYRSPINPPQLTPTPPLSLAPPPR